MELYIFGQCLYQLLWEGWGGGQGVKTPQWSIGVKLGSCLISPHCRQIWAYMGPSQWCYFGALMHGGATNAMLVKISQGSQPICCWHSWHLDNLTSLDWLRFEIPDVCLTVDRYEAVYCLDLGLPGQLTVCLDLLACQWPYFFIMIIIIYTSSLIHHHHHLIHHHHNHQVVACVDEVDCATHCQVPELLLNWIAFHKLYRFQFTQ